MLKLLFSKNVSSELSNMQSRELSTVMGKDPDWMEMRNVLVNE
jgi:hypothetical protein